MSRDEELYFVSHAADGLAGFFPEFSAREGLARWVRWFLLVVSLVILAGGLWRPDVLPVFLIFIGLICLAGGLLRYVPVFIGRPVEEGNFSQEQPVGDEPIYTILVPLFKEAHMLSALVDHLRALDWPRDKLDIKIILEEVDDATRAAATELKLEPPFEVVIVPDYFPRTKAKACNYALFSARGEFVTIYDAEDRPRADQLRCAWDIFRVAPRELACLQAPLRFFNADKNWLARQFAIEYILQFMFFLPFIIRMNLPIFLGGSSNHFRLEVLRELQGWDAYNVTEDADIGLRLARRGYSCAMLPSTTEEEAVYQLGNWISQRSRWIKGWLQTWLVAMRAPRVLWREIGWRGFIFLQLLVPVYILALFVHLLTWPTLLILMPDQVGWIALIILVTYGLISLAAQYGCRRTPIIVDRQLSRQCWLMSFYWLLMGIAACRALFYLVFDPFYWDKTDHGEAALYKKS